jgi:hypothetical protein
MWRLDRSNSADLIDRLRQHARHPAWDTAEVGEGWRPLVEECHDRLSAVLPYYELLAIKQKEGILVYQAFPRPARNAEDRWTRQEWHDLGEPPAISSAVFEPLVFSQAFTWPVSWSVYVWPLAVQS